MFAKVVFACLALLALPAAAGVNIQHWVTREGSTVLFVENHDIPMLDVAVDFPAGSRFDTKEKSGLARLTYGMLDQGAGGLSDIEIAGRLADVGAQLGGSFDQDRAAVSLRTLSSLQERDAALELMLKILQQPAFPQAVFERERARLQAALKDEASKPGEVAEKAFYAALYGSQGYGLPVSGTEAGLQALSRDDLVAWYQAHFRAGSAVVSLMGDLSRQEAEQLAERISAGLPQGQVADTAKTTVLLPPNTKHISYESTQSHVLMGMVGMARNDPDYFPLYVGNYVLGGGGFDSRMINEVRQKRGYAYSAYSYFYPMALPGPFVIGLETKNAQADAALKVARDTVATFVEQGPTEAELTQAKNNLVGGFPLRIDSNRKILEYLRVIGFYQLPLTYLDDWQNQVSAVTLAQVHDAFKRRIHPSALTTIVVGGNAE